MLAEHQLAAAERAASTIAKYGGVLLADAPGLGKSYVAAAVAQRHGGPLELIVPAALISQWQRTLNDFRLLGTLLTHDGIIRARFSAGRGARRLLIVDEAHAFRNPMTQRYDALARRTLGADVLLVTATPLCNSSRDVHALLQLITRDDALAEAGVPSIDLAFEQVDRRAIELVMGALMIRREREILPISLQFGDLDRRVVWYPVPDAPIEALQFPLTGAAPLLRRFLRRRLESSAAALLESVRRQRRFYERVLESGRSLSRREYREAFAHEEDAAAVQQVLFWDLWTDSSTLNAEEVGREIERLDLLRAAVEQAPRVKECLLAGIVGAATVPALIFTGSAATARELSTLLGCPRATARDGREAVEQFRRGSVDLLVATDLASEGLNLQRAGMVVHYDIPWNPVKLDQRNGRAHRIGQTRPTVQAVYFLPEGDPSGILAALVAKNRIRRRVVKAAAGFPETNPQVPKRPPTLPPRVTGLAAVIPFLAAMERYGFDAPHSIERRNRAGLERLLATMSVECLDRRRMDDLLAIASGER